MKSYFIIACYIVNIINFTEAKTQGIDQSAWQVAWQAAEDAQKAKINAERAVAAARASAGVAFDVVNQVTKPNKKQTKDLLYAQRQLDAANSALREVQIRAQAAEDAVQAIKINEGSELTHINVAIAANQKLIPFDDLIKIATQSTSAIEGVAFDTADPKRISMHIENLTTAQRSTEQVSSALIQAKINEQTAEEIINTVIATRSSQVTRQNHTHWRQDGKIPTVKTPLTTEQMFARLAKITLNAKQALKDAELACIQAASAVIYAKMDIDDAQTSANPVDNRIQESLHAVLSAIEKAHKNARNVLNQVQAALDQVVRTKEKIARVSGQINPTENNNLSIISLESTRKECERLIETTETAVYTAQGDVNKAEREASQEVGQAERDAARTIRFLVIEKEITKYTLGM